MSFCQKHHNHHCIHAHQCTKKEHSKFKHRELRPQKQNKEQMPTTSQKNIIKSCKFVSYPQKDNPSTSKEQNLRQKNHIQNKYDQIRQNNLWLKGQNNRLQTENKHLLSQIQYYREQFSMVIDSNTTDNRNQIKKRLKQTMDLSLKIKSLQSQNIRLLNENDQLKRYIDDDKTRRELNKEVNFCLQEKYNAAYSKLKELSREKEQIVAQLENRIKELQRSQNNYDLLKKQFNFEYDQFKKELREKTFQLQQLRKAMSKIKTLSQQQKQITLINISSSLKKEQLLKSKVEEYEMKNKELIKQVKGLASKCQQLTEELSHSKIVIQRYQQSKNECHLLEKELNQRQIQTKTLVKQRQTNPEGKENREQNSKVDQNLVNKHLQDQIFNLKEKISLLQNRNIHHFQEVIMKIGASEAFKKLVEEKNTIIKKLMREKGEIYSKILNSQA